MSQIVLPRQAAGNKVIHCYNMRILDRFPDMTRSTCAHRLYGVKPETEDNNKVCAGGRQSLWSGSSVDRSDGEYLYRSRPMGRSSRSRLVS